MVFRLVKGVKSRGEKLKDSGKKVPAATQIHWFQSSPLSGDPAEPMTGKLQLFHSKNYVVYIILILSAW